VAEKIVDAREKRGKTLMQESIERGQMATIQERREETKTA